jgi:hypothetical protein
MGLNFRFSFKKKMKPSHELDHATFAPTISQLARAASSAWRTTTSVAKALFVAFEKAD